MHFIYATGTAAVVESLSKSIQQALQSDKRVLWLVSGGSTVPIAVAVMRKLQMSTEVRNLTIMQVDERYGEPGHAHANWQALQDAGFACGNAACVPVLRGTSLLETTQGYKAELAEALKTHDFRIGLFGIGVDGHTAGMLPNSSAAHETTQLVASYKGPDFTRITITAPAIAQLDEAIVYAIGAAKASALQSLRQSHAVATQPAQALKQAASTTVYTDYQGD